MTAIAQTLDGKETFETKKEVFDYIISELFDPKQPKRLVREQSYLQIGRLKFEVKDI